MLAHPLSLSHVHKGQIGRALVPTSAAVRQISIVLMWDSILLQRIAPITYLSKRGFCASSFCGIAI